MFENQFFLFAYLSGAIPKRVGQTVDFISRSTILANHLQLYPN